jgi:hypothetical protein
LLDGDIRQGIERLVYIRGCAGYTDKPNQQQHNVQENSQTVDFFLVVGREWTVAHFVIALIIE